MHSHAMINFLLKNIISFHEKLQNTHGIRDVGLIESSAGADSHAKWDAE